VDGETYDALMAGPQRGMRRTSALLVTMMVVSLAGCSRAADRGGSPLAGSPTTPPDVAWASIQKPGSWSLRYPSTWRFQRLVNECSGALRGAVVTDTSFQFTPRFEGPCRWRRFGRWIMAGFPDDGVALAIEPLSWFPLGGPDYPPVSMPPCARCPSSHGRVDGRSVGPVRAVAALPG
jgi:hypothetical protein